MAQATVINGTDLMLWITSGSTQKVIALAQSCKIITTMSTRKISSKDSGTFEESAPGRISWTCDSDNLFTQDALLTSGYSYDTLMDIFLARTSVSIAFGAQSTPGAIYPNQTIATNKKQLSGTAWITKLDLNAKDNDNASYTISLEGTSKLEQK